MPHIPKGARFEQYTHVSKYRISKLGKLALSWAALALGLATAAERDYIGWPYDARTFPLCQQYGCREVGQTQLGGDHGSFLRLQLLRLDAKVTLTLAPDRAIMGIYVLLPTKTLDSKGQAFLQRVLVKSANEDFDPRVLPACFAKLRPPAGDFYQRGIILTNDHYGVQCLRKREQGADYWGVWVFFDR